MQFSIKSSKIQEKKQKISAEKGDEMYSKDDIVMYASQGVCKITDITTKEIGGKSIEYYVLKPIYSDTALVYIPIANETLTGKMRRVLAKEEILTLIHSIEKEDQPWIENEHIRKEKYKEILSCGDRHGLISMIKALYVHRTYLNEHGKKMHVVDERFFKEAEKILYEEFAFVLNIKLEEVLPFIKDRLGIED